MNTKKRNLIKKLSALSDKLEKIKELNNIITADDIETLQAAIKFIENASDAEELSDLPTGDPEFYVYPYSLKTADEKGELEEWLESHKKNVLCSRKIDIAIGNNYDYEHHTLNKGFEFPLLQEFGYDRVCMVLACFTRLHYLDRRIHQLNKAWGNTFHIPEDDSIREYNINGHVGLVDLFITRIRELGTKVKAFVVALEEYSGYDKGHKDNPDHILNKALTEANYDTIEKLILDGKADALYAYLKEGYEFYQQYDEPDNIAEKAKKLLNDLNQLFPISVPQGER